MPDQQFADRHDVPDTEQGLHVECSSCRCSPTAVRDEWTHYPLTR